MSRTRSKGDGSKMEEISRHSIWRARLVASVSRVYGLDSSTSVRALCSGLILRVRELLLRDVDKALRQLKTSHARHSVLAIVCRAPDGLQLNEIAARAFVHPATMTGTIDRLLRDGLIERRADPSDRRGVLAMATPKGHELHRLASDRLAAVEFGLADVDDETINTLVDCLDKVAKVLEKRNSTSV